VSLPLSPLVFPIWFIDQNMQVVEKNNLMPWLALSGIDDEIISTAKEIGLGKYLHRIERLGLIKLSKNASSGREMINKALKSRRTITVDVGPNNIHDILDGLKH
jgi:hypothetical protein